MASQADLAVVLKMVDELSGPMRNAATSVSTLQQQADKATGPLTGLHTALSRVGEMALSFALGGGLLALPGKLMEAGQAAADDARSQALLQQALRNTGESVDAYGGQLEATANAGIALGFADEQVRESLALLLAQTGSAAEAQQRLAMAQDLARGTGMDLYTASRLLGKASDENANVLARYGIVMAKGADETALFGAVQEKFGGQAKAFAESNAGAMATFRLQMGEVQEALGRAVLPLMGNLATLVTTVLVPAFNSGLAPALEQVGAAAGSLTKSIRDGMTWLDKHKEAQAALAAISGGLVAQLVLIPSAMTAISTATKVWVAAQAVLNAMLVANPIGLIVTALAALAAGLIYVYTQSETFRTIVNGAFSSLGEVAGKTVTWLGDRFNALGTFISENGETIKNVLLGLIGPIGWLALAWNNNFGDIRQITGQVLDWVTEKLMGFLNAIAGLGRAVGLPVDEWIAALEDMRRGTDDALGGVRQTFDSASRTITTIWDEVSTGVGEASQTMSQGVAKASRDVASSVQGYVTAAILANSASKQLSDGIRGLNTELSDLQGDTSEAQKQLNALKAAVDAGMPVTDEMRQLQHELSEEVKQNTIATAENVIAQQNARKELALHGGAAAAYGNDLDQLRRMGQDAALRMQDAEKAIKNSGDAADVAQQHVSDLVTATGDIPPAAAKVTTALDQVARDTETSLGKVSEQIKKVPDDIRAIVPDATTAGSEVGNAIGQGMIDGLAAQRQAVLDEAQSILDEIKQLRPQGGNGAEAYYASAMMPAGGDVDAAALRGYQKAAAEAAAKYKFPQDIFLAQINQESGFNPKAQSPAGAQGIAQFMPGTAKSLGVDPWDALQSLDAAARYDADLLKKYGGNVKLVLAAYNAGEGAIKQWGGIPPYDETRRYIAAIEDGAKSWRQYKNTAEDAGEVTMQIASSDIPAAGKALKSLSDIDLSKITVGMSSGMADNLKRMRDQMTSDQDAAYKQEQAIAKANSDYTKALANEDLTYQRDLGKAFLDADKARIEAQHQERVADIERSHTEALAALDQNFADAQADSTRRRALQQDDLIFTAGLDYAGAVNTILTGVNTKLLELDTKLQDDLERNKQTFITNYQNTVDRAQQEMNRLGGPNADSSSYDVRLRNYETILNGQLRVKQMEWADADAAAKHAQDLTRATADYEKQVARENITYQRDMEAAKTAAQKTAVEERHTQRLADLKQTLTDNQTNLNQQYAQMVADRDKQRMLEADRALWIKQNVDEPLTKFKEDEIIKRRDADIQAAKDAADKNFDTLTKANEKERAALIETARLKIADAKKEFLDKIGPLTEDQQQVIDAFLGNVETTITNTLGKIPDNLANSIAQSTTEIQAQAVQIEQILSSIPDEEIHVNTIYTTSGTASTGNPGSGMLGGIGSSGPATPNPGGGGGGSSGPPAGWTPGASGPGGIWNNPSTGGPYLSWPMAAGGIVTAPTLALLGERGSEAVIPLGSSAALRPVIVNVTVEGSVVQEQDLARTIRAQLLRIGARNGGQVGLA